MPPKGIALVIGMPKRGGEKSSPPASAPTPEDDLGAELADMCGAKDPAAFTSTLKDFVRACVKAEESDEYDEPEE